MKIPTKRNLLIGICIAIGIILAIILLWFFFANVCLSSPGEKAGALGNVVGGIIGALGAALAVYLTLHMQRRDDMDKISAAILAEMMELCKSPIGQLTVCALIRSGQLRPPKSELRFLFASPPAVIYPSVADRISLLPRPVLVVTFYMQLAETKGIVDLLVNSAPVDEVTLPGHINQLADLLISQCQLARLIFSNIEPNPDRERAVVSSQRNTILRELDGQLAAARLAFPNAESFHDQH